MSTMWSRLTISGRLFTGALEEVGSRAELARWHPCNMSRMRERQIRNCRGRACPCPAFLMGPRAGTSPAPTDLVRPCLKMNGFEYLEPLIMFEEITYTKMQGKGRDTLAFYSRTGQCSDSMCSRLMIL